MEQCQACFLLSSTSLVISDGMSRDFSWYSILGYHGTTITEFTTIFWSRSPIMSPQIDYLGLQSNDLPSLDQSCDHSLTKQALILSLNCFIILMISWRIAKKLGLENETWMFDLPSPQMCMWMFCLGLQLAHWAWTFSSLWGLG
jgi:hypothetical protein